MRKHVAKTCLVLGAMIVALSGPGHARAEELTEAAEPQVCNQASIPAQEDLGEVFAGLKEHFVPTQAICGTFVCTSHAECRTYRCGDVCTKDFPSTNQFHCRWN